MWAWQADDLVPSVPEQATADPGIYPAHCHKVHRVTNQGSFPDEMATVIAYEEARETDEFAEIMENAGPEG